MGAGHDHQACAVGRQVSACEHIVVCIREACHGLTVCAVPDLRGIPVGADEFRTVGGEGRTAYTCSARRAGDSPATVLDAPDRRPSQGGSQDTVALWRKARAYDIAQPARQFLNCLPIGDAKNARGEITAVGGDDLRAIWGKADIENTAFPFGFVFVVLARDINRADQCAIANRPDLREALPSARGELRPAGREGDGANGDVRPTLPRLW